MVENGDGCVMPSECPTVSTTTEEELSMPTMKPKPDSRNCSAAGKAYMECGTACPSTCDNPGPTICTRQCVQGEIVIKVMSIKTSDTLLML